MEDFMDLHILKSVIFNNTAYYWARNIVEIIFNSKSNLLSIEVTFYHTSLWRKPI